MDIIFKTRFTFKEHIKNKTCLVAPDPAGAEYGLPAVECWTGAVWATRKPLPASAAI